MLLAKEKLIADIRKGLAVLQNYVRPGGSINLTDGHVQSESVVEDLLNQVYGWSLSSTNRTRANYPCIDLIDAGRKLGIQVTAEKDSDKVNETLVCLEKHKMSDRVAHLKVLLLVPKQKKYTVNATCPGVSFDWATDVLDLDDVIAAAQAITDLQHLGRVQQCVVNAMPSIFPEHRLPAGQNDFRIRDHFKVVHRIGTDSCRWSGPAVKPDWISTDPGRMSDWWIVERFAERADLHLYFASGWGNDGTWLIVDRGSNEGRVLNYDQIQELRQTSATTTTTPGSSTLNEGAKTTIPAISDGRDGQAAASALLQHYRDLYRIAGPVEEDKAFRHALQRSEVHAKETLKGKIILLTALVEQQLAKTTGLAVSSESVSDFGLLRALEWARDLRTFRTDIDKQVAGTEKMAPAYDRLEHVHKAVKELMDSLMTHADWSDSAEKAAPGTRDRLEALLSRVATLSENTVQTRPKRFITEDELKEAKWTASECTRIAMEVEKGAGRI